MAEKPWWYSDTLIEEQEVSDVWYGSELVTHPIDPVSFKDINSDPPF